MTMQAPSRDYFAVPIDIVRLIISLASQLEKFEILLSGIAFSLLAQHRGCLGVSI